MTLWLTQSYTYNVSLTHTHTHWWGPFGGRQASDVQSHWESQQCFLDFSQHSMNLCVSRRFGITWDMSHVPSRRRPLNFCKACENLSCHWSGLVFTSLWIVLKSPVCSQEEPEGMASASGISHAATAFTSSSQRSRGSVAPLRVRYSRPACSLFQQPADVWSGLF